MSTSQYANVSVPGPTYFIPRNVDNGKLVATSSDTVNLTGVTEIGDWMMAGAYLSNSWLSGDVDLSGITTLGDSSLAHAFESTAITGIDLSGLTSVEAYSCEFMCAGCTDLETVDISSLASIDAYTPYVFQQAFTGCTSLTTVTFDALETLQGMRIFYFAFSQCTSLTSLSFPALTSSSFGSNTNQFQGMLTSVSGCTVHFPSNLSSVIGTWTDVTNGFGGTNTTVLFDLTATE